MSTKSVGASNDDVIIMQMSVVSSLDSNSLCMVNKVTYSITVTIHHLRVAMCASEELERRSGEVEKCSRCGCRRCASSNEM